MRLNQFIAESGMCSRRFADKLIESGKVFLNGTKACLGMQVSDLDAVTIDGQVIKKQNKRVCIMVNKPVGITSTTDKADRTNIIDFVGYNLRLFTIGRLDKDSEGLLLLTNDGNYVNALLRSENNHEKEYEVMVNKRISDEFITNLQKGVKIYNPVKNNYVITKTCIAKKISEKCFKVILTEGYNRQIRRMCQTLGYKVITLKRTRFLFLKLANLKVGEFRTLNSEEMEKLDQLANLH